MAIEFRLVPKKGARRPKTSHSITTLRRIPDPRPNKSGMTYIRYLSHEKTCFVDEQDTPFSPKAYKDGTEKIVRKNFNDGLLKVEEYDECLLEFLRNCPENEATPSVKNVKKEFYEVDVEAFAENAISTMDKIREAEDFIIGMDIEQLQIVCMTLGIPIGKESQMIHNCRLACMTKYEQILKIVKDSNMDVKTKLMKAITLKIIKKEGESKVVWADTGSTLVPLLPKEDMLEVLVGFFNLPQNRPQYEALCLKIDLHTTKKTNGAVIQNDIIKSIEETDPIDLIREAIVLDIVEKKSMGWISFNGIKMGKEKDLAAFVENPDNEELIGQIKAAVLIRRTT